MEDLFNGLVGKIKEVTMDAYQKEVASRQKKVVSLTRKLKAKTLLFKKRLMKNKKNPPKLNAALKKKIQGKPATMDSYKSPAICSSTISGTPPGTLQCRFGKYWALRWKGKEHNAYTTCPDGIGYSGIWVQTAQKGGMCVKWSEVGTYGTLVRRQQHNCVTKAGKMAPPCPLRGQSLYGTLFPAAGVSELQHSVNLKAFVGVALRVGEKPSRRFIIKADPRSLNFICEVTYGPSSVFKADRGGKQCLYNPKVHQNVTPFKGHRMDNQTKENLDLKDGIPEVITKAAVIHAHEMSRTAGVLLFKRMVCNGKKCSVFKSGLCIDIAGFRTKTVLYGTNYNRGETPIWSSGINYDILCRRGEAQ